MTREENILSIKIRANDNLICFFSKLDKLNYFVISKKCCHILGLLKM